MKPALPDDLRKWESIRKKGKTHFILSKGVLGWGIPMFAIMTFVVHRKPDTELTPKMIAISALIYALGGCLFGWSLWFTSERKYLKHLASQKHPSAP